MATGRSSATETVLRVLVVTDPMCSWCWGMSPAVEVVADRLAGDVEFDFLLGGVNTHGTQPIGNYGRRLLMHIWREVQATTGQHFGFRLPEGLVFNSTLPCLAVAAVRVASGHAPFGYLHRLQQLFFAEGASINDVELLLRTAEDFGADRRAVAEHMEEETLRAEVMAEFAGARGYGTSALPSVLIDREGERRLLTGGYADADMLEMLIRQELPSSC